MLKSTQPMTGRSTTVMMPRRPSPAASCATSDAASACCVASSPAAVRPTAPASHQSPHSHAILDHNFQPALGQAYVGHGAQADCASWAILGRSVVRLWGHWPPMRDNISETSPEHNRMMRARAEHMAFKSEKPCPMGSSRRVRTSRWHMHQMHDNDDGRQNTTTTKIVVVASGDLVHPTCSGSC